MGGEGQPILNSATVPLFFHCSPCPESSQNWPYLSSSCFSPLAAHWFMNAVQTRFATTASTWPLLSTWLNWQFTNPPASYTCSDAYILCLPSVHTYLLGQSFLMLHCLSGTVPHQIRPSNIFKIPPLQAILLTFTVCAHAHGICFNCVLFFVMGYALQFREIACKRVHYYYWCGLQQVTCRAIAAGHMQRATTVDCSRSHAISHCCGLQQVTCSKPPLWTAAGHMHHCGLQQITHRATAATAGYMQ